MNTINNNIIPGREPPPRQHGAALVIGLILLLIMTVLGVSSLGTSAVEVRIADNNKQQEYAFQSGESATREELITGAPIQIDGTEVNGTPVRDGLTRYTYDLYTGGADTATVEIDVGTTFRSRGPAPGFEIGVIDAVHFELTADARAGRGAHSRQRQGFFIPAPTP